MQYYVHESSVVDDGARLGRGTKVWHFSHVMAGAVIGEDCSLGQNVFVSSEVVIGNRVKIQNNVSIYDNTRIDDDVFLGPSCVLTNISNPRSEVVRRHVFEPTLLMRGATVGANATVVCGHRVGRFALVAAGAVVASDVADYALMMGVPARRAGWVSRHGHRLVASDDGTMVCVESGLRYRESGEGVVTCMDLDEDAPLPDALRQGRAQYATYKSPPSES